MSLLQSPLSCHDLYCSTSPFCRDHSLLSIHYSTGFSWCHFQLLFLCALFPMGHLLSYCKKYYPTQLWLLEIMHLFLISTSPRNICKLYFLEIFSEYFMKVELRLCWLEDSLSPESSQHSRSQARVKEEGCVRFWQTSIKNSHSNGFETHKSFGFHL